MSFLSLACFNCAAQYLSTITVVEAPITTMIQTVGLNAPPISGKKKKEKCWIWWLQWWWWWLLRLHLWEQAKARQQQCRPGPHWTGSGHSRRKGDFFPYRLSPLATLHRHRTSSHYCNQTKTNLNLFFAHAAILGDQESSKGTNQRGDPHLVKFLAGQLRYQILTNKTTNPNTITNVQMYKNNCKQINVNGFCWPTVNRFQIPKIQIQTPMYLQVTFKALQNTHCGICHEQTNHYEQPRDWIVGKANLKKFFFFLYILWLWNSSCSCS